MAKHCDITNMVGNKCLCRLTSDMLLNSIFQMIKVELTIWQKISDSQIPSHRHIGFRASTHPYTTKIQTLSTIKDSEILEIQNILIATSFLTA